MITLSHPDYHFQTVNQPDDQVITWSRVEPNVN